MGTGLGESSKKARRSRASAPPTARQAPAARRGGRSSADPESDTPKARLQDATIDKEAVAPEDQWLSPDQAAAVLGMSKKWLDARREGRKQIDGPPFKKLEASKTSPIRYDLAELRDWPNSFPSQVRTFCAAPSLLNSASDFYTGKNLDSFRLCAEADGEMVDFFVALNGGVFERKPCTPLRWLNSWEWLRQSASTGAMSADIQATLSSIRARALYMHEERALEQIAGRTVNPKKSRL